MSKAAEQPQTGPEEDPSAKTAEKQTSQKQDEPQKSPKKHLGQDLEYESQIIAPSSLPNAI